MRKFVCLLAVLFATLFCESSEAGPFGLRRGGLFNGFFVPTTTQNQQPAVQPAEPLTTPVPPPEDPSLRLVGSRPTAPTTAADHFSTRTAQGVANRMAALNFVGHFGGNPGYEGCGCGPTPAAAYNICCYGRSGMPTIDVGYAQSSSGQWYCCRRYQAIRGLNPRI